MSPCTDTVSPDFSLGFPEWGLLLKREPAWSTDERPPGPPPTPPRARCSPSLPRGRSKRLLHVSGRCVLCGASSFRGEETAITCPAGRLSPVSGTPAVPSGQAGRESRVGSTLLTPTRCFDGGSQSCEVAACWRAPPPAASGGADRTRELRVLRGLGSLRACRPHPAAPWVTGPGLSSRA